jgi:hypothetical protein
MHGPTCIFSANLTPFSLKSFPVGLRGTVTGLVKTGNGISSGIYTQVRVRSHCHFAVQLNHFTPGWSPNRFSSCFLK